MIVNTVNSVNEALLWGLHTIAKHGVPSDSRNGTVRSVPLPVTTRTRFPDRRVLFVPNRGENPFFHFVESLWMLDGRNDLKPLAEIVSRMKDFSDDGGRTQPGAYGHRWRHHFGHDQLDWAVRRLKADPNDRRVVVSMWDGRRDPVAADQKSADVPCNTHLYLLVRGGATAGAQLDMTVCCRSNDLLWGAHGANAVHFSVLQEYLAARIGVRLGEMWQVSNNYHLYDATLPEGLQGYMDGSDGFVCPYSTRLVRPCPLFSEDVPVDDWDEDLSMWWREPTKYGLRQPFFRRVATPILMAHRAAKAKDFAAAREALDQCVADDWATACLAWLNRAEERQKGKAS